MALSDQKRFAWIPALREGIMCTVCLMPAAMAEASMLGHDALLEQTLMQSYAARSEDVDDLRAAVKQLSIEQSRMRADLSNFSNHATQLMSALQMSERVEVKAT
eukprot:1162075-Pelagomonas_calceolata.AAC.23